MSFLNGNLAATEFLEKVRLANAGHPRSAPERNTSSREESNGQFKTGLIGSQPNASQSIILNFNIHGQKDYPFVW